ncbi:hypothetical protein ASE31_26750 [Acidovorax sp. Root217]|nr:hypothetical protein ASE31_26750 [Acidovorax sp. Root217]
MAQGGRDDHGVDACPSIHIPGQAQRRRDGVVARIASHGDIAHGIHADGACGTHAFQQLGRRLARTLLGEDLGEQRRHFQRRLARQALDDGPFALVQIAANPLLEQVGAGFFGGAVHHREARARCKPHLLDIEQPVGDARGGMGQLDTGPLQGDRVVAASSLLHGHIEAGTAIELVAARATG